MTFDTHNAHDAEAAPSGQVRLAWLALIVLLHYWCLFDGLAAFGLVGPDEPRYAAIARGMADSGDWVTPRLHGQPWFEKPILYYWAAATQYKLWGDSEVSARLPSALAATLTSLTLGWLALRLYGWRAAQIVTLLFPTSVAAIGFGRAATMDMLFTASLALAMLAATRIVNPGRVHAGAEVTIDAGAKGPPRNRALTGLLWRAGLGAALGLAALAKGPAALVLAGGSAGMWMLATRRWRDGLALASPAVILAFALVALPWYVLCGLRNPEFVQVFLISHNVQRFLTPVFQHQQPFWFFGPILLLGLLPWTPLLIGVAGDGIALLRERRWASSPGFFIACWAIVPVLFFSVSRSKLPGYVLPAIPPLALLLARSLSKGRAQRDTQGRWQLAASGAGLLVLGALAALPLAAARMPGVTAEGLRPLAVVLLLGGAATVAAAILRRGMLAVACAAVAMAAAAGAVTRGVLPAMDAQISPRAVARALTESHGATAQQVAVYQLHRAWQYGMNYYLHAELPEWSPEHDTAFIVTSEAGLRDLRARGVAVSSEWVSPKAIIADRREVFRPRIE